MDPVAKASWLGFFWGFSVLQKYLFFFFFFSLSNLKSPLALGKIFLLLIPIGTVLVCCRFSAGCPDFPPAHHHALLFWMCLSTCRNSLLGYHDLPEGMTRGAAIHGQQHAQALRVIPLIWGHRPLSSAAGQSAGETVRGASWMQSSHMDITSWW